MKKPVYIRCPRCELNYIEKKEKFCQVCKNEMKANGENKNLEINLEICPICHINYMNPDQDMCDQCATENVDIFLDEEEEQEWKQYIGEEDEITEEEDLGSTGRIMSDNETDDDMDDEEDDVFPSDMFDDDMDSDKDSDEEFEDDDDDEFEDDDDEDFDDDDDEEDDDDDDDR